MDGGGLTLGYPEDACAAVVEGLEAIGLDYFIHVPDSFGAPVISHFEDSLHVRSFPVAREEEGIGIASGLAMAGKRPSSSTRIRAWATPSAPSPLTPWPIIPRC